jgi:hypothetical protein
MNSVALCDDGKHESVLALTRYPADNAGVPPGVYTGRFVIEARRARTRAGPAGDPAVPADREHALVEVLTFDYAISIEPDAGVAPHPPPDAATSGSTPAARSTCRCRWRRRSATWCRR